MRGLAGEREELQLKCNRLESTIKTAELDTQASRETILRLVSENKKRSKEGEELLKVQEELEEQRELLKETMKEKEELQQRLVASRETIGAMERELHSKDKKCVYVLCLCVYCVYVRACMCCFLTHVSVAIYVLLLHAGHLNWPER